MRGRGILLLAFALTALAVGTLNAQENEGPMSMGQLKWNTVNDTVMGGRSSAKTAWNTAGELVWTGDLSLENNGGFVSIRSVESWFDWSAYDGVELSIAGAGRDVQVTLQRADGVVRAGGYRAMVNTKASGDTRVFVPFSAFVLKRFGRRIDGPHLNPGLKKVGQLGLLIADKKPGPFKVVLKEFKPVRRTPARDMAVDVGPLLVAAIAKGVPAYNNGDAKGCAEIYRTAMSALVKADKLGASTWAERLVSVALTRSSREADDVAAWTLRRAMDAVLYSLEIR